MPNFTICLRHIVCILGIFVTISNTVKIEELRVPEVIQVGNSSDAILDCCFSGVSDQFTVQWLFNDIETPVYQWSPHKEPQINGVLDGHLDLKYNGSSSKRSALRLTALRPELSGEYTCRLLDHGADARLTKTILVFSPEKELKLEFLRKQNCVEIKCIARGLYPQPELTLEKNSLSFTKQQQRTWRSEGLLYDAENIAHLAISPGGRYKPVQITCRLQLPQAGYTAIKKELLYIGKDCSNASSIAAISIISVIISLLHNKYCLQKLFF